ncbi:MAG: ChuX/HutX family heme-like substrate-binding protein, partial [Balneolales bacterium]
KQGQDITIREQIGKEENIPIDQIESKGFLEKWSELKDTHDFYPLLRKFKAGRTDALRLAEGKFTTKVNNKTVRTMLNLASEDEVPIMVFVGNPGMIQIHSGPVITIRESGNWLNILDAGFNLHLRQDHIADSWIVEKPTEDGTVTSLELFDEKGESIATFFGARKPGKPELESWRTVIRQVKSEEAIQK